MWGPVLSGNFRRSELAVGGVVRERFEIAGAVEPLRMERDGIRRQWRPADVGRKQLAAGARSHDPESGPGGVDTGAGDRQGADERAVLG